jgi:hemerythrin-like domain-containing protein
VPALEHAAIHQKARVPGFHQGAGSGNFAGTAEKAEFHALESWRLFGILSSLGQESAARLINVKRRSTALLTMMAGDEMGAACPRLRPQAQAICCRALSKGARTVNDALITFRDEHRKLAAVLQTLRDRVEQLCAGGGPPDFGGLRDMLYYLDAFPARRHHPMEEQLLFMPLRARGGDADAAIAELEREHACVAAAMGSLEQALLRYEAGGEREFVAFATAMQGFCDFYLRHMHKEETLALPLAEELFGEGDWARMDAACAEARELPGGADEEREFEQLFRRIVGGEAPAPAALPPSARS